MAEQKPKLEDKEEKPLTKDVTTKKKTFREKLQEVQDNITVEPLLAGFIIPSVLSMFAMVNLNLDKACRVNLGYSDEICDALIKRTGNYTEEEKEVQKLISSTDIWRGVLKTLLPCIIIMFLGAWSDRTGKRKLCILLPILGELLTSINNLINVYFFYEIPVEVTVFMETIFGAATGGWVTIFLGVFSYISDITSEETRTFRVGLVNFCMTVGVPIGIGMSGILLKRMGYYGMFTMTAILFFLVLMYGCFCLKEPDQLLRERGKPPIERPDSNKKVSFFNISHVVETVSVAFRKRANKRRVKVLLTLFTVFILYGPTMSEHSIIYLFVRARLNWDMVKYGLFTSYSIILHSCGAMFSITVLSKRLQVDDSLLCLISVSSRFVGAIWTAFVQTDLEMYLVPLVEILNGTTFTSLRSIISKLVDKQETAKINSLFSLTETVASLLFHPFYSWMYMKTLHVMAGAVFLVSATLIIPASGILILFYVQHRRELSKARKKALEADDKKEIDKKKANILSPFNVPESKDKIGLSENIANLDLVEKKDKLDLILNEKSEKLDFCEKPDSIDLVSEKNEKLESNEKKDKLDLEDENKETIESKEDKQRSDPDDTPLKTTL
ncbi:proton-coupled folate transporter-like [Pectinophora gossypiella]|uniref:proton-coupled folate transporter-like n=1 Tax=Pectinophora gossypiella TaxID=13191 RepID=UPI00214EBF60|nr:proton-coupled folate transporter-like [Pectinophora gossypiella]